MWREAGLFRRRLPRHADLSARHAGPRRADRRSGDRGGVRLHHRGVPGPASRRRPPRHYHHPVEHVRPANAGDTMNVRPQAAPPPYPPPRAGEDREGATPPQRDAVPVDPIVLQIVEGTLNSIEPEIDYPIEPTPRSPTTRESHHSRA